MVDGSQSKKKKAKHKLNAAQAADYLRQLADQLDKGQISFIDEDGAIEGEVKVKESYKAKPGKKALKVQLKLSMPAAVSESGDLEAETPAGALDSGPDDAPAPESIPGGPEEPPAEQEDYSLRQTPESYKKLKKRMAKDVKLISKLIEADELPSLELARAFHDDCGHMTSFPGKGDPYYGDFDKASDAFFDAVQCGDMQSASQAMADLMRMKKDCHKEFK